MDAAWNDLQGEDAVLEMFALTDGNFRFQSGEVSSSNIGQSISFMLMETARLTDEVAAFADHIPSATTLLRSKKPFEGDDADAHRVSQAIAEGCTDLAAVQRALRMSAVRLGLAVRKAGRGRIRRHGRCHPGSGNRPGGRAGGEAGQDPDCLYG